MSTTAEDAAIAGEVEATTKKGAERVVLGGATSTPRMNPRPKPLPTSEVVQEFVTCAIRGPLLAALATKAVEPYYRRWLEGFLARGGTHAQAFATSLISMHLTLYFGMFGMFEAFDRLKLFQEYKIPRTQPQLPTFAMELRTMAELTVGQVLNYFLAQRLHDFMVNKLGAPLGTAPLPSFAKMVASYSLSYTLNRVLFASVHRLFHYGPLYRFAHRKHHQYVGSVSIAAEHAHPVEALTANLIPSIAGSILTRQHPLLWFVWFTWRLEETFEAHSGYSFRGSWLHKLGLTHGDAAAFHDAHHGANRYARALSPTTAAPPRRETDARAARGNFGDPMMDHFFGTMDHWISIGGADGYMAWARKTAEADRALRAARAKEAAE